MRPHSGFWRSLPNTNSKSDTLRTSRPHTASRIARRNESTLQALARYEQGFLTHRDSPTLGRQGRCCDRGYQAVKWAQMEAKFLWDNRGIPGRAGRLKAKGKNVVREFSSRRFECAR
jgi:hypothetical protein